MAAVEIVGPSKKDRPDSRGALLPSVPELVRGRVSVALVDVVTTRHFNLLAELLDLLDRTDPAVSTSPPDLYAAVCRSLGANGDTHFAIWPHTLAVGEPLPCCLSG